jgi:hypothetical protein
VVVYVVGADLILTGVDVLFAIVAVGGVRNPAIRPIAVVGTDVARLYTDDALRRVNEMSFDEIAEEALAAKYAKAPLT